MLEYIARCLAGHTDWCPPEPVGTPRPGEAGQTLLSWYLPPAHPSGWPTFQALLGCAAQGSCLYLCGPLSLGMFASGRGGGAGSHLALWPFSPGVSHGHQLSHSFFQTLLISEASPARLLCFKHFLSCYFLELLIFNQLSFVMNDTSKNVPCLFSNPFMTLRSLEGIQELQTPPLPPLQPAPRTGGSRLASHPSSSLPRSPRPWFQVSCCSGVLGLHR